MSKKTASNNIKRFGLQKEFRGGRFCRDLKRTPSSKLVKAREDAKGVDILSSGQS